MRILGISALYHDSAAAIVADGRIMAAAQEERFTRKKHDASFPRNAIAYCLDEAGIALDAHGNIACDAHLRTSVAKGIEIIEGLRGHTTGYGIPQFVIDAPGGGGKVPINPGYILYHDNEKIVIRNYEGKIFEYPETGNENVQFAPQREYHDEYLYS